MNPNFKIKSTTICSDKSCNKLIPLLDEQKCSAFASYGCNAYFCNDHLIIDEFTLCKICDEQWKFLREQTWQAELRSKYEGTVYEPK